MTTKVMIQGVTIETTGGQEVLIERVMDYYLLSRHSRGIITPPTREETEMVREALKA